MMDFLNRICTAIRSRGRCPIGSAWLLAATLAMTALQARAACTVSIQGVNFGSYDPFSSQSLDSTGNIGVNCNASTAYTISLSPGTGSYMARSMTNGVRVLNYNLYIDAARAGIWGDGTSGTLTVSGTAVTANHTVYGRISARQNAYVGSYSDTITVTVNF